jgi:hypothetical protein
MKFLLPYLLLSLIIVIHTDIPTHCLKSQVIGKWTFSLTHPAPKDLSGLYKHTCGHKLPSNEKTSHLVTINPNDYLDTIIVDLNKDNQATMDSNV